MRESLAILTILCTISAVAAADVEATARAVEGKLMAPCCGALALPQHYSGPALEMKREIRVLLAEGKTEKEILRVFVERHGEQILAAPPMRGFGLMAYLLPLGILVFGWVLVGVLLRRWKRSPAPAVEEDRPRHSEAYAERIREELRKLG